MRIAAWFPFLIIHGALALADDREMELSRNAEETRLRKSKAAFLRSGTPAVLLHENLSDGERKRVAIILRGESFRTPELTKQDEDPQLSKGRRRTCGGADRGVKHQTKSANGHLVIARYFESLGYDADFYGVTYPCSNGDASMISTLKSLYPGRFTSDNLKVIPIENSNQYLTLLAGAEMARDSPLTYEVYVILRWDALYPMDDMCFDNVFDGMPHDLQWFLKKGSNIDVLFTIPRRWIDSFMAFVKSRPPGDPAGCCEEACPVVCQKCIENFMRHEGIEENGRILEQFRPTALNCDTFPLAGHMMFNLPADAYDPFREIDNEYDEACRQKHLRESSV